MNGTALDIAAAAILTQSHRVMDVHVAVVVRQRVTSAHAAANCILKLAMRSRHRQLMNLTF